MAKVILLRGPSGSGKSTLARKLRDLFLREQERWSIVEVDDYFVRDGVYTYIREEMMLAHDDCRKRMREVLERGDNVIIANTMIHMFEVQGYEILAKKFGASVQIIRCVGAYPNSHNVSDKNVRQMWRRYEPHENEKIYNEGDGTCF